VSVRQLSVMVVDEVDRRRVDTYTGTVTPAGVDDKYFNATDTKGGTFYHKFQGASRYSVAYAF